MIIIAAIGLLGMFIYGFVGTAQTVYGVTVAILEQLRSNREIAQRNQRRAAREAQSASQPVATQPIQPINTQPQTVAHPVHKRNGQP